MAQRSRLMTLWTSHVGNRRYLIPDELVLPDGPHRLSSVMGSQRRVDSDSIVPFEVAEDQARRWAKDQLGQTLDELKLGIDEKLAELRRRLDEFNRRPVSDASGVAPNAASALFDFVKRLPRVVWQSLSSDPAKVDAARDSMADIQRRLQEAGIDVDDRIKAFPDRLAVLRKGSRGSRD